MDQKKMEIVALDQEWDIGVNIMGSFIFIYFLTMVFLIIYGALQNIWQLSSCNTFFKISWKNYMSLQDKSKWLSRIAADFVSI